MIDLDAIEARLGGTLQAITDPENQPHQWMGDSEGLLKALNMPILLAEIGRLQELVALQRRLAEGRCEKIAELDGENGCLRAELAAERERRKALEKALPEAGLLEQAAWLPFADNEEFAETAHKLLTTAAAIRAVQEMQHVDTR